MFYYCNIIWCNAAKQYLMKRVLLQKRAVRTICNKHFLSHTEPIFC